MKKFLLLSLLLKVCYTETKKPDHNFMTAVKQQASLDSDPMTTIEIVPAKFYFGQMSNVDSLSGSFVVKNTGIRVFYIAKVHTGCSCISLQHTQSTINPGDSLIVHYQLNVPKADSISSNSISVVGNCPSGNKTYYFEATIIH